MRRRFVLLWVAVLSATLHGQQPPVKVTVLAESDLRTMFISTFKEEAQTNGFKVELVDRNAPHDYTIVLAQESTVGSAAAAVIALDASGDLAASVVRSGRLSAKGAINACTKELAKKIAVLKK